MYTKVLFSICLSLSLLLSGSYSARARQAQTTPAQLYKIAWFFVKSSYLDTTYNGQDIDIWRYENRYKGHLKTFDDSTKAIETMLMSLGDRYTRYLDRESFQEEKRAIKAKLTGVGIQIAPNEENQIIVIAPIQDSPAFKAGIKAGDQIIEVDNKSTSGLSIEEVASKIRGLQSTKVSLLIQRGKEKKNFQITRDEIHIKSVPEGHSKKLNEQACYIHLVTFLSKHAAKEVAGSLAELGDCPGLILDLRNNPGGLFDNSLKIADMFLERDSDIVSTVDRYGYVDTKKTEGEASLNYDGELIVLVNGGSASATEILSGALQDHGRAELIGSKTFGKGLVQFIPPALNDGSGLHITTSKYLTPNGHDIHEIGIVPDQEVNLSLEDLQNKKGPWFTYKSKIMTRDINWQSDLQLKKAVLVLKQKLSS